MKRKLSPWELERKKIREMEAQVARDMKHVLGTDAISFGRSIGKKRKNHRHHRDVASFGCPECEQNIREDIIRLRPDFFQCRKCGHTFHKDGIIDEFDFDGLEEK